MLQEEDSIMDCRDLISEQYDREKLQTALDELRKLQQQRLSDLLARVKFYTIENINRSSDERKKLIKLATENCRNETVLRWLRENSESDVFSQLADMFHFLKKHIDEEEKKNHSNSVDITFVAHGAIRDSLIPASCLLPLSTLTDVLLYSPWNCTMSADVVYAVATGRMKLQHRVFTCGRKHSCQTPDEGHRPTKLPDCWNSIKKAGHQKIPNITLSPLRQPEDGVWKRFESLSKKYGPPERNRIVIPFILPADSRSSQSVPFSVVSLAFSLVLLSSRFQATIHLAACLGDQSAGRRFDKEYLQRQYACAVDSTMMSVSPLTFTVSWMDSFIRFFGI